MDLVPPGSLLAAFLVASLILAVTPGPGVIYIVTRSLAEGRRAGIVSALGVAVGNLGNALAAALGLGAVLAVSPTAFTVLRLLGGGYLVFIGVQTLRHAASDQSRPVSQGTTFRDGVMVAFLNPKTAIFFAAFLPQFMSVDASPMLQIIALACVFVTIALSTDVLYALAAGTARPFLVGSQRAGFIGRRIAAVVYIALGLFAWTR